MEAPNMLLALAVFKALTPLIATKTDLKTDSFGVFGSSRFVTTE